MNMKKIVVSALAAVTAAVAVSAVGASANTLGVSTLDVPFEKVEGEGVSVTATLNGQVGNPLDVTATLEDGSLSAGKYYFHAELLADKDEEDHFLQTAITRVDQEIDYFDLLEINFKDEKGNAVQPTDVKLTFKTAKATAHIVVYQYDNGWKLISDSLENAVPLHFSRFVIAALRPAQGSQEPVSRPDGSSQPSQSSQPGQPSQPGQDVKTGDSTTTAIVFAVMALVALGTSVVAVKAKKASK